MKETDLAKYVIQWLSDQHWDVYQEVQFRRYSGIADIAAVQNGRLWIIECKTSLTFTVLEQASFWRSHYRSIAVPETHEGRGRGIATKIAHDYLKLGVLAVKGSYINVWSNPPIMREHHMFAKQMIKQLLPEHKTYCNAGSRGGGYYTPYRQTMDVVKRFVTSHPGCTLKEIFANVKEEHHYSSDATARNSIRIALSNWETWCEVKQDGKEFRYFLKK